MPEVSPSVRRFCNADSAQIEALLGRFGLETERVADSESIPGSFWGDEEAGLIENRLIVREDTPVHSIFHEACHYVCMDPSRREGLDTDAGGDYDEESAVCYLQVLLADEIDGLGRNVMFRDMDAWGYSFRLGSARAWFETDAEDARQWLLSYGLITQQDRPTYRLRSEPESERQPAAIPGQRGS